MNKRNFQQAVMFFSAFFLGGCLSGTDDVNKRGEGPLYSCIGEPGYARWALESLQEFFDKNPPICVDGKDTWMGGASPSSLFVVRGVRPDQRGDRDCTIPFGGGARIEAVGLYSHPWVSRQMLSSKASTEWIAFTGMSRAWNFSRTRVVSDSL